MKNLLALVTMAAMYTALIPATAAAENGPISGSFTVTYTAGVVGTPPHCDPSNSVYAEAHGIGNGTGALGTMMLTIRKCFNYLAGTYAGSFALSSPDAKDTVTGTYAGSNDPYSGDFPAVFFPFHGMLTVTGGTGKFSGAKGTMNFTALATGINGFTGVAYYAIEANVHD